MSNIQQLNPPLLVTQFQDQYLLVTPIAFPAGVSLSSFTTFALTLRSDPAWPRQTAAALQNLQLMANPLSEGWPVVFSGTGTGSTDESGVSTVTFFIPNATQMPSGPNALVAVVIGSGGSAGRVQLLQQTLCSVLPGG